MPPSSSTSTRAWSSAGRSPTRLRSDLAIDALEMAVWNRTRSGQVLDGLVHHSDRGVQYLSIRYSERLAENDIVASVGSRGDSFDNAMAEAFNSLYKWELVYPQGPWTRPRRRRVRHARLHRLVQPPPPARRDHRRQHLRHAGRVRSRLLPSNQRRRRGGCPIARAVMEPGAVQAANASAPAGPRTSCAARPPG